MNDWKHYFVCGCGRQLHAYTGTIRNCETCGAMHAIDLKNRRSIIGPGILNVRHDNVTIEGNVFYDWPMATTPRARKAPSDRR